MRKSSKEQLLNENDSLIKDCGNLHLALNDVLNKKVTWFRKGEHRLGISRENGASGGILIHRVKDYAIVQSWEDWWPKILDSLPSATDVGGQDLKDCAMWVHEHVMKMRAEAISKF